MKGKHRRDLFNEIMFDTSPKRPAKMLWRNYGEASVLSCFLRRRHGAPNYRRPPLSPGASLLAFCLNA
jgi:hypothetical protein